MTRKKGKHVFSLLSIRVLHTMNVYHGWIFTTKPVYRDREWDYCLQSCPRDCIKIEDDDLEFFCWRFSSRHVLHIKNRFVITADSGKPFTFSSPAEANLKGIVTCYKNFWYAVNNFKYLSETSILFARKLYLDILSWSM